MRRRTPLFRLTLSALLAVSGLATAAPQPTPSGAWSPAAECSPAAIAARRQAFAAAHGAGDHARALEIIDPLWRTCFADRTMPVVLRAEVENDYALGLHAAGDDSGCIQMLEGYSPGRARPTPEIAALPARLRAAIRFNYGLCRTFCDDTANYTDAACAWMRTDAQFDSMAAGDFRARPCAFRTPKGAVAMPDGACLALTPSPSPFDADALGARAAARVCPGLALHRRGGGVTPLAVPAASLLRNTRFCCADPVLAVDKAGRIEIQPAENPPEDCRFGHRETVLQDVLRLEGTRLTLVHRLHRDD